MSKKWSDLLLNYAMIFCLVVGLGALFYPAIGNAYNDWYTNRLIRYNNGQRKTAQELKAQLVARQEAIRQDALTDPYSAASLDALSFKTMTPKIYADHMIGEIFLPTIAQHLPIFDNVGEQFLQKGATWLSTSSTLFGGENTHSAVSAHSGIPSAKMFSDLHHMALGDLIIYKLGDEYLAYRVFSKTEVAPSEPQAYAKVVGKDLTTLITCTPIGVNSHRLLVTGERVPFKPAMMKLVKQTSAKKDQKDLWGLGITSLIFISGGTILVLMVRKGKCRQTQKA
ncbi:MAG: class C sortase [Streptococcaceae bacterium]|jgi:sortase A|nr:class C sortase [Streptococcaceae bacterium]